ncbi:MAG TPA: terminase TerL endonuclease subunit, partial [Nitrospiraceae bacterium]|nr:terminase TerL endonuclease subunit [Nitrospiraceae bacterium]
ALTTGSAARREPLWVFITTAGTEEQSICYREYEYAQRLLKGLHEDARYLPLIWEIPQDLDWTDEANWPLANPGLDRIVRRDELRAGLVKALAVPSEQNAWRRLHGNQWVNSVEQWIPLDAWDKCRGDFSIEA